MKFELEEKLQTLTDRLTKVSIETEYELKKNNEQTQIVGKLILKRECKYKSRVTEVIDHFPIDITISKDYIDDNADPLLSFVNPSFEFNEEITVVKCDLEITNISKKQVFDVL
ncbi:hypothetical protein [Peribacillus alkalitolerans]|uniref:hypothetical protein n=1 Tax=Peribacillus alkalitolerans TaxID=1550385 RepID=UPI0013D5EF3D|nr:hypothetical protein [Peribacillus alkalitolerans]